MKRILNIFLPIFLGIFPWVVFPVQAADVTLNLTPEKVEIGTFYNGTAVEVKGIIPADAEAVIRLKGDGEDLHLKKKGKVGGLLWMNTGDLVFHNAPRVYQLYTSNGLNDLTNSPAAPIALNALVNSITISPEGEDKDFFIKEFIRLKQKEQLYAMVPDGILFDAPSKGVKAYKATLDIPPRMKPGTYTVEITTVQNGNIAGTTAASLPLQQVDFPAKLSKMAFGHGAWYGVMSVVIALLAGLIMGVLFKGKAGAH